MEHIGTASVSPNLFRQIFETTPDLYLLLSSSYSIVSASNEYLAATHTTLDAIVGRKLFDVFPDNPHDAVANGVKKLTESLDKVLATAQPHKMEIQKYDVKNKKGIFETRFWSPINIPILGENGKVTNILHRVEDVTQQVLLQQETQRQEVRNSELEAARETYAKSIRKSVVLFQKIFDLSPVALYMTDAEQGRFIKVNNALERLFQLPAEAIIGKNIVELGFAGIEERVLIRGKILACGGKVNDMEVNFTQKDGTKRKMLISTEKIELEDIQCFLVAMVDITQRTKMEDELRKTNTFLDTILENIPDMIFVKDAQNLRFLNINKAGEAILGMNREELIGKNDYDLFSQEQADFFTAKDREAISSNLKTEILQEPIQSRTGFKWLHTKKIPVFEQGAATYLLGISEDITEKKSNTDAILALNKDMEAFTYSVSHDLRSPLRAITGFAQLLGKDYSHLLDDEGNRRLKIVCSNAEKMGKLIDDLLSFSKLGKTGVRKSLVDMTSIADIALDEVNKTMPNNAIVTMEPLGTTYCDPSLITQVFTNLIHNALKYSNKKAEPQVQIYCTNDGIETVYTVQDNGAGFDMRYAHKLFGVFQRLHSASEFEGTGVGLAIVQRIVQKHGGRVWAESVLGEWTKIYFTIPHQINS